MYDVAIVGGGVNGLAIAREAASRGLRVILFERNDIASGTTAVSSHLIHGGLKYLERLELPLVLESIREQRLLLRNAPHLVHDYPMLIPFYRGGRRPALLMRCGLLLHDVLALTPRRRWSRAASRRRVMELVPSISTDGLRGGAVFMDAQVTWPERLCVELMIDAEELGADVHTHTSVTGFVVEGDRVTGVRHRDGFTGAEDMTMARVVLNVTGPWIDQTLSGLRTSRLGGGTKGSHLVVGPFPGSPEIAVFFEAKRDGRPVFVLPWNGAYLLGSTDLTFDGDLDHVRIDADEVDYLLAETNHLFPSARLRAADVQYAFSGVRPLPYAGDVASNAQISRDHEIHSHAPDLHGLMTIIGGKLTTHRGLAENATEMVARELGIRPGPSATRRRPLPGAAVGSGWAGAARRFVERCGLPADRGSALFSVYGIRAQRVVELMSTPTARRFDDTADRILAAEIALGVIAERALTLADSLLRRVPHELAHLSVERCTEVGIQVMTDLLDWTPQRIELEHAALHDELTLARTSLEVTDHVMVPAAV